MYQNTIAVITMDGFGKNPVLLYQSNLQNFMAVIMVVGFIATMLSFSILLGKIRPPPRQDSLAGKDGDRWEFIEVLIIIIAIIAITIIATGIGINMFK